MRKFDFRILLFGDNSWRDKFANNLKEFKIKKKLTAILPNLKGNSKLSIIRQLNSILNLSILPNSSRNLIPLKGFIGFRKEFGNIDKFSIEFGCRIIDNFEFPFKFGRIAVFEIFINYS